MFAFHPCGELLFAPPPDPIHCSYPAVFQCYKLGRRGFGLMSRHGAGECSKRRHVAVEVWMASGGCGHGIKRPIPVTGVWDEGRKRGW